MIKFKKIIKEIKDGSEPISHILIFITIFIIGILIM